MFAGLAVDGTTVNSLDEDSTIELTFATDTEFRCTACGADLVETPGGFDDDTGESDCPAYLPDGPDADDTGPHTPERVALAWCNSAGIRTDETDDAITLSLSTGDPRGAFTITIRRVPDDADSPLAGRLLLHLPHPGEPTPHEPLHPLHPGTFVIGRPAPTRRGHLTAA
ncbi:MULTISPECIES: hypothetical protein [Protofrankia]|uniref:Uncharacterized protein n=1 Tax=Protofrankia coriariae TaxID=1562887 RepID=A0ABR5EZI1_9ACTN|nr:MULTISPECIES: hypothetical protein [Protofrankia]KLL09877.1 hypothetical protein FrCorBMG51_21850 [Protofrankia coriariae]ONH34201.1 hypothetical protein BL254_17570 [Protofrankia sp. BMG5.30]